SAAGTNLAPGLTSSSIPISSWANLKTGASTPPLGGAGSAIAYDSGTNEVVLFAGSSPFNSSAANGSDTVNTWTYQVGTQTWTEVNPVSGSVPAITTLYDTGLAGTSTTSNFSKTITARALAGYGAIPNLSVDQMTTSTLVAAGSVDPTERIVTIG